MKNFLSKTFYRALLAWRSLPRYVGYCIFRYGKFHITPACYKHYCVDVTNYLNQRKSRHSLCDIGCGLGDILLSCDYQFKVGLDRNKKVINALKLRHMLSLSVGKLIVKQFRFATDHVEGEFDVIVMCNWIHKIESKVLKLHFEKLVNQNLKPQGELIFDTVKGRAYPFCHDVGFLTSNLNVTTRVLFKYSGNQLVGQAERRIVTVIKK